MEGVKVYIGNLVYSVKEADLMGICAEYGQVQSAEIVRYKKSGRSKGFGYVRFASMEQAQNAMLHLNGKLYLGRALQLDLAQSDDPPGNVKKELDVLYKKWAEKDKSKEELTLEQGNHTPFDFAGELPDASHQLPDASHELLQPDNQLPDASHELRQPAHQLPDTSHELPQPETPQKEHHPIQLSQAGTIFSRQT